MSSSSIKKTGSDGSGKTPPTPAKKTGNAKTSGGSTKYAAPKPSSSIPQIPKSNTGMTVYGATTSADSPKITLSSHTMPESSESSDKKVIYTPETLEEAASIDDFLPKAEIERQLQTLTILPEEQAIDLTP